MTIVEKDAFIPNSMSLESRARLLVRAKSRADIVEACELSDREKLPLLAIGGGTNVILGPKIEALVLLMENMGVEIGPISTVQAGEDWDSFVAKAVGVGLSGIESLSAIPGSTGAAPVQNIGAYGSEIKDILISVEAYDREKTEFVEINNKDCGFGYRESVFKREPNKFVIASIKLKLNTNKPKVPEYKDAIKYFADRNITSPTLQEIREAIIEIRSNKLPDPKEIPNCGSFFKNPILDLPSLDKLKTVLPAIPTFPFGDSYKVPAGHLIEQAGFKGKEIGKIKVYEHNALVLTNPNNGSYQDILSAKETIEKDVLEKFGIKLEPEVNFV